MRVPGLLPLPREGEGWGGGRRELELPMPINLGRHLDDVRELRRIQARAADQAPITQRKLDIRLDVARVDASAVKDSHLARGAGPDQLPNHLADQPHRFVRVLGVCALAAADRPYRLVRDHKTLRS